ncbi:uncharacterized protein N7459_009708 [Penicillium hispanicum]|uniref:uncharacterized protein n=1 Tax=Penicillium hispanicum TaxID=1080232 RepID=UPI00254220B7|nr:uncharacterized protein N7459_009708 [Penicillium hispanicum]KAJ5570278.1 hypothetical protein N7459_009708 [Penicillium hispanicum]
MLSWLHHTNKPQLNPQTDRTATSADHAQGPGLDQATHVMVEHSSAPDRNVFQLKPLGDLETAREHTRRPSRCHDSTAFADRVHRRMENELWIMGVVVDVSYELRGNASFVATSAAVIKSSRLGRTMGS